MGQNDFSEYHERRAQQGRELAAEGILTTSAMGSISEYSEGQIRRMFSGERTFHATKAFAQQLEQPIKVESVGKLDKGPHFCILTGALSGQRVVLDLPELLKPDGLAVRNLRFVSWPRSEGN